LLLRRASSSAVRKSTISLSFFLEPQVLLFGEPLLFVVDAAEVELAGAGLERLSILAEFELGLLRLPAFLPLLGELAFEELPLDGTGKGEGAERPVLRGPPHPPSPP
jgi:hypothetical protein